jgi:hypothetical protein
MARASRKPTSSEGSMWWWDRLIEDRIEEARAAGKRIVAEQIDGALLGDEANIGERAIWKGLAAVNQLVGALERRALTRACRAVVSRGSGVSPA